MKEYTSEQILALAHIEKDWERSTKSELIYTDAREDTENEFNHGSMIVTNTHKTLCIKIMYQESYYYDTHEIDTFTTETDGSEDGWSIEGFELIDYDGGDDINVNDISEELPDFFSTIYDDYIDIKENIVNNSTQALDTQESESNENLMLLTIYRDNKPNFQFFGKLLASASSYSAYKNDRWVNLYLYKTQSGLYVCAQENHTCWQGENNRYKAETAKNIEEIQDFFGYTDLSKELYAEANIDATIKI